MIMTKFLPYITPKYIHTHKYKTAFLHPFKFNIKPIHSRSQYIFPDAVRFSAGGTNKGQAAAHQMGWCRCWQC